MLGRPSITRDVWGLTLSLLKINSTCCPFNYTLITKAQETACATRRSWLCAASTCNNFFSLVPSRSVIWWLIQRYLWRFWNFGQLTRYICISVLLGIELYLFLLRALRNLHMDPLSFIQLSETKKVKLNPYIYTLSKLFPFVDEISSFYTQKGGIQNSRRNGWLIRHDNRFTEEWLSNCSYVHSSRKH